MIGRPQLRRTAALIALLGLVLGPSVATAGEPRYAVVVGSNTEVLGRGALRYAHDDAKRLAQALVDLGDFDEANVRLLLDPRPEEVLSALDALLTKADGRDAMLLFFYSGHADAHALYPDGAPLPISELSKRLESPKARLRLGIVDACRGGGWTGAKGLVPDAPFDVETPSAPSAQGTVFVASSSGHQSAHESEAVAGSFFTHHLVAALRGAADDDADGVVALSEAYAYARRRTIRDAALYTSTEQNPSFRVSLLGRQDVSLTWTDRGRSRLVLGPRAHELQVVELASGATVLELGPSPKTITLALDAGRYVIRRRDDGSTYTKEVELRPASTLEVTEAELAPLAVVSLREKAAEPALELLGSMDPGSAPRLSSPAPSVEPAAPKVSLRAPEGSTTTFFLVSRQAQLLGTEASGLSFDRLCTAPCEAEIPVGTAIFGLSNGKNAAVVAADPVLIAPGSRVHGTYVDRDTHRKVVYGLFGATAAVGLGFGIAALVTVAEDTPDSLDVSLRYGFVGIGTMIGSGIAMAILRQVFADSVELEVQ
ncbi:MAG: caspase family protein [Deltaproteobacteria bacterium]|nr:caspase family protein [Deltaproteobacteria bacterium]